MATGLTTSRSLVRTGRRHVCRRSVHSSERALGAAQRQDLDERGTNSSTDSWYVQAADMNADGIADIVISHLVVTQNVYYTYTSDIFFGADPNQHLSNQQQFITWGAASNPQACTVSYVDVNADGFPDAVVTCQSNGLATVRSALNDGTGSAKAFITSSNISPLPSSTSQNAVVIGDFNGDGYADVMFVEQGSGPTMCCRFIPKVGVIGSRVLRRPSLPVQAAK